MKTIFSLYILFLFSHTFSQTLNADTEYYDAVDKWVAIPAQDSLKNQKHIYEFIYIGKYFGENAFALTEMGVNMAQVYFLQKNESKFRFWLEETRKYAQKGSQYDDFLNLLESEWTKENSTNLN